MRKGRPFPEDIEGRLNTVLNVVNNGLKSVSFLHLDDVSAESGTIKKRVRQSFVIK